MQVGIGIGIDISKRNRKTWVGDSFTRADNASTLGNAETGQPWITGPFSSVWGILSNQARCYTLGITTIESGKSDLLAIRTTVIAPTSTSRVIFRLSDLQNNWYFGGPGGTNYSLVKRIANVTTNMVNTSTPVTTGDRVRVELRGSTIKAYVNNVLLANIDDNFNLTATQHGFTGSSGSIFDNFSVDGL
jgi:hypothetical protein